MLERVISGALQYRGLTLFITLCICVAGGLALTGLNIDAFPDTTPMQVQINTAVPALIPEEIERQVTYPIELAMSGMKGLQNLRSLSQFGLSQVVVTFEDGIDIYFARQMINERLTTVELPAGIPRPEMGPVSTGLGEVFHYLVMADETDYPPSLMDLTTTQNWRVKPALRPVSGTAEVNTWGGLNKQYQVRVDPSRLFKYELTFQQVVEAVRSNNLNVGGGNIQREGDMLLVQGIGRTVSLNEIRKIVITAKNGVPICVDDVADVVIGHEIRRGAVTANGKGEAVLGLSFMLMGENSYAVTQRMARKFHEVQATLPPGTKAVEVYNRTELVDRVIATVRNNLCEGALLVVALLYVFLGDLRSGLIAAVAIPVSMLFGFCGMYALGIAGTLLSLGAIDFGIVVDSSCVVIENILRHLGHQAPGDGRSRLQIIRDAAVEVRTPTVFGQLIIMIVYIPILTLEGVEGKMFRPMALTVVFILLGSLLLSLTLTPVLSSLVLPRKIEEKEALLVRALKALYAPVLRLMLLFRWAVLGLAVGVLGIGLWIASGFGAEFVPRLSEGSLVIGIVRPPGTSLEQSIEQNTQIEQALLQAFPDEISHLWSRQGGPEVATDSGSIETTDLFVMLKDRAEWKKARTQDELVPLMEKVTAEFVGQQVWFTQPIEMRINEMISGVRADVALKLFGEQFPVLIETAGKLDRILREIPGNADLTVEQISGQPILQIRLKQEQLARYGVPANQVLDLVESVGGKLVGDVIEDQLRFPLVIRLPDELRTSPESIAGIELTTPAGDRVPLSRLAEIKEIRGPKTIQREWSTRRITLQCNVRGRDVGSFVAEAQRRIAAEIQLPAQGNYRLEWGGQFENMQRAQQRLTIVVPLALSMIVVLLYLTYRTVLDTSLVFLSVPFACVGGVLGLYFREMPLSISAAVGFITLSGVSVLNGMVLVSYLREQLARQSDTLVAVRDSCLTVFRTVLMTGLVASVGFIPMAISSGTGAEVQRPLATVVIGGIITSMLFTLLVLPVCYAVVRRRPVSPTVGY